MSKPRFLRAKHATQRWVVFAALVLATLAPMLSHAVQWARGGNPSAPWLELCFSRDGRAGGGADPAGRDSDESIARALEHCAYCVVQPLLGLPGADRNPAPVGTALRHEAPTRAASAAQVRDDAPPVLARGPPVLA